MVTSPKTDGALVVIIALLCITTLMSIALKEGINGKCFALALCILGGLGGLKIKDIIDLLKR